MECLKAERTPVSLADSTLSVRLVHGCHVFCELHRHRNACEPVSTKLLRIIRLNFASQQAAHLGPCMLIWQHCRDTRRR